MITKSKISIIVFSISCSVQTTFAQYALGIQGGADWGSMSIADAPQGTMNKALPGSMFGLTAEMTLNEYLSITLRPAYVQKGTNQTLPPNYIPEAWTFHLSYIQFPIFMKFQIPLGAASIYAIAGPNFAYLQSATVNETLFEGYNYEDDVKGIFKKYEFTTDAGIGFQFKLTQSVRWDTDFRYSIGFENINTAPWKGDSKTRSFQIWSGFAYLI